MTVAHLKRIKILKETIEILEKAEPSNYYNLLAEKNLYNWKQNNKEVDIKSHIKVYPNDWGEVSSKLSQYYGECFAVLNMANAYIPGGGYLHGMTAQESNMYRRTDCHFYVCRKDGKHMLNKYSEDMTDLINGKNGRVYLDVNNPRVCLRGNENWNQEEIGYSWLKENEMFPFYELRAAAQKVTRKSVFNIDLARHKIIAQLETLKEANIRFVVLGAFGCGAHKNPPEIIAQLYKEEIGKRKDSFSVIAFAVADIGFDVNNYDVFKSVLEG